MSTNVASALLCLHAPYAIGLVVSEVFGDKPVQLGHEDHGFEVNWQISSSLKAIAEVVAIEEDSNTRRRYLRTSPCRSGRVVLSGRVKTSIRAFSC